MEPENRITKAMKSLENLERAKAPTGSFSKIQQKLASQRMQQQPANNWMKVAAVVALVVCSNLWAVSKYWDSQTMTTEDSSSYPELMTDYNLYDYE